MVKYGLFATRNETLMSKLNDSPVSGLTFGSSTIIICFEKHKNPDETKTMKLVGVCQIKSKWQPFEWQDSPFTFAHHGAFVAKWLYCREFDAPKFIYISSPRNGIEQKIKRCIVYICSLSGPSSSLVSSVGRALDF